MKSLRIEYFAFFREQAGCREETFETEADTPAAVYNELGKRYSFKVPKEKIKVGINHEFGAWDQLLEDGDVIAFIPPVAGG